jgi:hypothetical protein
VSTGAAIQARRGGWSVHYLRCVSQLRRQQQQVVGLVLRDGGAAMEVGKRTKVSYLGPHSAVKGFRVQVRSTRSK